MGVSFPKIEHFFAAYDRPRAIRRILDIGCTNLSLADAEGAERLIASRGGTPDPAWLASLADAGPGEIWLGDLLAQAGFEYVAYDIFPGPRTRLFDLNCDAADETFDLVLNFGTTEHVLGQWNAMKVIHDACRPGGLIWHDLPMAGYLDHGYFNYNPMLFRQLAEANDYAIRRMLFSVHGGTSIRERLAPRYADLGVEVSTSEAAADRKIPDAGLLVIFEKRTDAPFRGSLETSTTIGRAKAVAGRIAERYGAPRRRPPSPAAPPPSAPDGATTGPEIGPHMAVLNARMASGGRPDTRLLKAALEESLAGPPPADPRLGSIMSLLRRRGENIDWRAFDDAVRRWSAQGALGPGALRRACDAALAGGRTIDDLLAAVLPQAAAGPAESASAPQAADLAPAAYPHEKALYIADLLRELTGEDATDVVEPLARLFSTPADRALESAYALLSEIRTPIPGFPFMGERGGDAHFFFLADACQRCFAASRAGTPPIPVVAIPKSASAFVADVLSRLLDIPVGTTSLRHLEAVPAWIAFAARHPLALHDHLPPTPENMERLRASGCRRLVLQTRDPRQLVLSLAHHVVRRGFRGGQRGARYRAVYEDGGLGGVIDAVTRWELPELASWLDDWMKEARRGYVEIKIARYEDLRRDPTAYFADLLGFFGVEAVDRAAIAVVVAEAHAQQTAGRLSNFREGSADEWRSALRSDQAAAIAAACGAGFRTLYPDLEAV